MYRSILSIAVTIIQPLVDFNNAAIHRTLTQSRNEAVELLLLLLSTPPDCPRPQKVVYSLFHPPQDVDPPFLRDFDEELISYCCCRRRLHWILAA